MNTVFLVPFVAYLVCVLAIAVLVLLVRLFAERRGLR